MASNRRSETEALARGYAVEGSPGHINRLACAYLDALARIETLERDRAQVTVWQKQAESRAEAAEAKLAEAAAALRYADEHESLSKECRALIDAALRSLRGETG